MDWKPFATALVRHLLTGLAGVLVADGVLMQSDAAQFAAIGGGVVVGLGSLAWSWWQKHLQAKRVDVAVATAQRLQ